MDQDHGSNIPLRASIPRLSRLPMPRAMPSNDNLRLTARTATLPLIHHDDLRKNSTLPRPATSKEPLLEKFNQSIRARYGWNDNPIRPRSVSPVRDALRDAHNASLDTTPPSSNSDGPLFEEGNENASVHGKEGGRRDAMERRRPRPSLSERTVETLAQISPCPSPAGRRPSLTGIDASMPPPMRPASSMRESRPGTPASPRPDSPSKRPFRPPGRMSPTKDLSTLPPVISPGNIYTPPKAFVRGHQSRIAKPPFDSKRSVSSATGTSDSNLDSLRSSQPQVHTMKSKHAYGSKTISSHTSAKPSLASIFKDPPTTQPAKSSKLAISDHDQRSGLLRPKTRGENAIAPSTPPSAQAKKPRAAPKKQATTVPSAPTEIEPKNSPRSSAALRETIAKAKAAKRKALESTGVSADSRNDEQSWPVLTTDEEGSHGKDNEGTLRQRIQRAIRSGHLDVTGMALKQIPQEVTNMYESENSTATWSEMVDLTKFIAADNEIEELEDHVFPDLPRTETTNDDEKFNQFGGVESIDLHRNLLVRLPIGLRRLERLQALNLSNNKLTNPCLSVVGQIQSLKELLLGDNLLTGTLDFGEHQLEKLQILDVRGNKLQSIDAGSLGGFTNLKTINLSNNLFNTLPWDTMTMLPLMELVVSKNKFSGTLMDRTAKLRKLRTLDASFNSLGSLWDGVVDLPNIRSIKVNGNCLTQLPDLSTCDSLHTLLASENQLEELPLGFTKLRALKTADIGYNNIRVIDAEIALMEELSNITLAGNPLREKKYLTMSTSEIKQDAERKLESQHETSALNATTEVQGKKVASQYRFQQVNGVLDLSSQSLTGINLDDIDLSDSTGPIHTIKLSNNDLSAFPFDLLSQPSLKYSLQSLDLSHNPLLHPTEYLTSELFLPSLKSLYIVSTGLTSLDALTNLLRAPALSELNISCHRLAGHVPWVRAWFPNCTTLLATDNWFSSVDTEGVRGLEVLDIRNNEIEALPAKIGLLGNFVGAAKEPGKLRIFEVSGNKFRVPRLMIVERGSEAVLKDLRRMIPEHEVPGEWKDMV